MERKTFGLLGAGAFGSLAAQHLAPHFDLILYDAFSDTDNLAARIGARKGTLGEAASSDIVMLSVPVQKFREVLASLVPHLKPKALVLDVCSVKMSPMAAMEEILPSCVDYVGTHPLFGPQSGKNGIAGLNFVLCEGRGGRSDEVAKFCTQKLGLKVERASPEEHDHEAAYVQGLTHMLAKIVVSMDLPKMRFPTRTYELMMQMVEMVRYDSEELFRAIESENAFSGEAKKAFFTAARELGRKLRVE